MKSGPNQAATKADLKALRNNVTQSLRTEWRKDLRATEKRLDARIDAVGTDVRHVKIDVESVKDDVKKIAEVVVSIDAKLDRHIAQHDAHVRRWRG